MIEIIQETERTEEKAEVKLPKNIRQIGNPEKDFRIYMEDYVYTYLHPAQIHGVELGVFPRLLILIGEIEHFSNRSCAFISGAVQVEGESLSGELPELNEKSWKEIHKDMRQYFDKCEIVGWVLDIPGNTLEITKEMEEAHWKNFPGKYQFFFLMDSRAREEAFFTWKDGMLTRKEGYFIYYEKNPQMQEYMISRREEKYGDTPMAEEVKDQAAQNYRAMILEKKEHTYKRRTGFLSYLTSLLMVIILCSVSVILIGNIRRMEHMEESISAMSVSMETTEQAVGQEAKQVTVEAISGNVYPIGAEGQNTDVPEGNAAVAAIGMSEEIPSGTDSGGEALADAGNTEGTSADPGSIEGAASGMGSADESAPSNQVQDAVPEDPADQSARSAPMTETERYRNQGYYMVQAGDNLRRICYNIYRTYAIMDKLCEVNGIDDQDAIYIGQKLMLP